MSLAGALSLVVNVYIPWTSASSFQISVMVRVKANNNKKFSKSHSAKFFAARHGRARACGKFMGTVWQTHGIRVANSWDPCGKLMGSVWQTHGIPVAVVTK